MQCFKGKTYHSERHGAQWRLQKGSWCLGMYKRDTSFRATLESGHSCKPRILPSTVTAEYVLPAQAAGNLQFWVFFFFSSSIFIKSISLAVLNINLNDLKREALSLGSFAIKLIEKSMAGTCPDLSVAGTRTAFPLSSGTIVWRMEERRQVSIRAYAGCS